MATQLVRADLRFLSSPDADPLEEFHPNGPFGILVQAIVGPAGAHGEESFDFMLCTPEWFASDRLPNSKSIALGRYFIFVREFNYAALKDYVRGYCASCEGDTWTEVAEKIARFGHSEFEDYKPFVDKPPPRV
jgi:hypothetical protein